MQTRIFIVDDDTSFGRSLKRLLNAKGYTADHFKSALAFLDSVPYDQKGIAVVDICMPDCDGFALMDRMHASGYSLPVIVITGHSQAHSQDEAMQRRAIGFLEKPFSEHALLELVEAQTTNKSQDQEKHTLTR
jgi:FixJ family two-component response regulator